MTNGTCQSCGTPEEQLSEVRRIYVTPESWDSEERITRTDDVERWCFSCRTHYPHEPLGT